MHLDGALYAVTEVDEGEREGLQVTRYALEQALRGIFAPAPVGWSGPTPLQSISTRSERNHTIRLSLGPHARARFTFGSSEVPDRFGTNSRAGAKARQGGTAR